MKRFFTFVCALAALLGATPVLLAQSESAARPEDADAAMRTNAAAATQVTTTTTVRAPDLLEHLVDEVLNLFNVRNSGNTITHYVISALFLVGALLLRRVVTGVI